MSSYSPNPTAAAQPAVTVRRSRRRIGILALLAIGTMINYLDRTVLGIAAPKLTAELGIDPAIMGILFSAFAWTYALAQIPGGLFLDRFGNKVTYFLWHCCKVSDEAAFCLIQRPYISKTLLTRRISPRGSP